MKKRRSSYGNVEMLKRKRDEKEEKEREWEETFGRSKKTSKSPIRKREEGTDMGEEEARGSREELEEMFRIQKEK